MPGRLAFFPGPRVVDPKVELFVFIPVADKIDFLADPEGKIVGAGFGGDPLRTVIGEIVDPDILLPAGPACQTAQILPSVSHAVAGLLLLRLSKPELACLFWPNERISVVKE